jgi:hypothetical protein
MIGNKDYNRGLSPSAQRLCIMGIMVSGIMRAFIVVALFLNYFGVINLSK